MHGCAAGDPNVPADERGKTLDRVAELMIKAHAERIEVARRFWAYPFARDAGTPDNIKGGLKWGA
jgi:hypothetical protein